MRRLLILLLLPGTLVMAQTPSSGPQTVGMMKESPAGEKVLRVLNAINGDLKVDDAFMQTNFTAALLEKAGEGFAEEIKNGIRQEDGTISVYAIDRKGMFEYQVLVKASKSGWLTMTFLIDSASPYRIKGFMVDDAAEHAAGEVMVIK